MDVIALHQAGVENAVAPLGTALTENQLELLWKMTPQPVLCFDGDGAGRRAAYRAVDLALPQLRPGKSLRFAVLPEGQDPDDLARSGSPFVLAGTVDEMCAQLLERRERLGISYITVPTDQMDALAPVVARLAGR
jgi:DNA primase